jgi:hypothetical protein
MKNIFMFGCVWLLAASGCKRETQTTQPTVVATAKAPEKAIVTKAKSIVLPQFKLDGVTLSEAVQQLSIAGKQNDPENKGVNFMIQNSDVAAAIPKITLALKNVTLEEATEGLAKAAGISVSAQDYAFVFNPKSISHDLLTYQLTGCKV